MTNLLIDDAGQFWDGASARVREAFSSPYSGDEFSDYVVRNLGFIAVNQFGSSVQVRLHPLRATTKALAGLVDWVEKRRLPRIALAWYSGSWRYELLTTSDLLWRVDKLVKAAREPAPDAILTKLSDLGELPGMGSLQVLMQHMPKVVGPTQQQALLNLVRRSLDDRYLLADWKSDQQRLVFSEFGSRIFLQQLPWKERTVGKPVEDQPDPTYGQFAMKSYEQALKDGKPRFESVDAIVNWADGRRRLRYRRLIIPFRREAGGLAVLCGSLQDDRVDLRVG